MDWDKVINRLLELDYRKDVVDRNPWIGRISLYDLVDALAYGTGGDIFRTPEGQHKHRS